MAGINENVIKARWSLVTRILSNIFNPFDVVPFPCDIASAGVELDLDI